MGTLCGILGPLVAAVGALLLAYDAFRSPVRWHKFVDSYRKRLEAEKRMHESILKDYRSLPIPPYSDQEIKRLADEEIRRFNERIEKEQEETSKDDLQERLYSFKLAAYGFLLVAIGSVMQAIAAYLGRPK
jgi:hypothetical protein